MITISRKKFEYVRVRNGKISKSGHCPDFSGHEEIFEVSQIKISFLHLGVAKFFTVHFRGYKIPIFRKFEILGGMSLNFKREIRTNPDKFGRNPDIFRTLISKLLLNQTEWIFLIFFLDESSDSAIHTVYERIKGIKGYKMT